MNPTVEHWYHIIGLNARDALRDDWKFPVDVSTGIWRCDPTVALKPLWLELMKERLNAEIPSLMVFHKPANFTNHVAHIDLLTSNYKPRIFALNWLLGGLHSEMRWYKTPTKPKTVLLTPAGTPYKQWPVSELTQVDSCDIGANLTFVRTDSPHAIFTQNESRWCFSIRPVFKNRSQPTTWEDAVATFQHLLISR